jgi:putative aldouronate transport system permease protein
VAILIRESRSRRVFVVSNTIFLIVIGLSMLIPFLHIIAGSFSSGKAILAGEVSILPVDFNFSNYASVLSNLAIWKSFGVTTFITIVGTFLNVLFTALMAYALSKKNLKGRSIILFIVVFSMIFQAPIIPNYLLVKSLGMLNTVWSLIIPTLISAFNLIIMISFFRNIPDELIEAAKIDGCGEYKILWKIVMPLSLPSLTTIGLFYAVAHWNGYYQAMMYITEPELYPLQVKLREILVENSTQEMVANSSATFQSAQGVQMATIIIATLPILLIYPMIQKHFKKGANLGSIKE